MTTIHRVLLTSLLIMPMFGMSPVASGQESAVAEAPAATDNKSTTDDNVTTADISKAAKQFLATLDDSLRSKTVFEFDDNEQRQRWSNLPVGMSPRAGVRLGDLNPEQTKAAMQLLEAVLSEHGYEKSLQIVEGDEVLLKNFQGDPENTRGYGRDNYFFSILGEPSATKPWMLQFGGHHLALNITFVGEQSTLAPSHTGANPAIYTIEGKTIRPLGHELVKAYAMMESLDDSQREQAVLDSKLQNLVLGPGRDGQMIAPEGLKGSELTEKQQALLLELASEWTGIVNPAHAAAKNAELKDNINETWFAWSGPTATGSSAYFRIQGPTVFIEFAPQGEGEEGLTHIHTIYRDPTNEYGTKWWKR
ncbi:DUF3500 domain-containing protein [Aeoliella mucimassa]|uniref:DUF3500 domain-containing protein n=1 Tax=Aeoliella mucimassa TaxID=2527972 RepID=A0A518AH90_9BACT|nr:DUF3500 domain-containing protein [Aeoliella mucimassa]QDU54082.1 hypothetical protein Pan181_02620 [Aeoliella mucimassa]